MPTDLKADIDAIQQVGAVPKILDVVSRLTGMGFVAVARVTSDRWVCCAVRDTIEFGLEPGGELRVETTICNEIRQHGKTVFIDDAQTDEAFCHHPTPAMYGFRSYISAPIVLADGEIWGTLCAIDPRPRELGKPEILGSFQLLSELIAAQLELDRRFEQSQAKLRAREADLMDERKTAELREQFIGVLGHDLRNPLASVEAGMRILLKNLDTGKAPEIISMVQKSVIRMAGLVDNIMDFARGRLGGGLTIKRDAKAPLTPVLEQVIDELERILALTSRSIAIEAKSGNCFPICSETPLPTAIPKSRSTSPPERRLRVHSNCPSQTMARPFSPRRCRNYSNPIPVAVVQVRTASGLVSSSLLRLPVPTTGHSRPTRPRRRRRSFSRCRSRDDLET
jgi:hypothetical protein